MLNAQICPSCGASDFSRLPDGQHVKCNYCGTISLLEKKTTSNNNEFEDFKLTGNMSSGCFSVHNKLLVTGNMNNVRIVKHLENSQHVSKLKITGNMNTVTVQLLDGASYRSTGNMNTFNFN